MKRLLFGLLALVAFAALGGQWIDPVPFDYAAALGRNGSTVVNKFGHSEDIDASEMTVWDGNATAYGGPDRAYANQSGPFTLYVSSDDATNTMVLEVQGIAGTTWDAQTTNVTLSGLSTVAVTGTWERVFRAKPAADLAAASVVYLHLDSDAGADGVPDNPSTEIVAIVHDPENQTMMNVYTVPDGFSFLLKTWCISVTPAATAADKIFRLRTVYPQGTASRTQRTMVYEDGTGDCLPIDPPLRFQARADIEITAESASDTQDQPVTANFDGILIPD